MMYRSYKEFYDWITKELPGWDVILGNTAETIKRNTCFITHKNSELISSDDSRIIASSKYDLVFLSKRAAFTYRSIIEQTTNGVDYTTYDDSVGYHIFTAQITLYGSDSIPED